MDIPGSVGRYRIIKVLGKGAFGIVYLAEDPQIERLVALKTISAEEGLSSDEQAEYRAKIVAEAQAAGKLLHPNIVTVFDVFEHEGATYIAMEYLDGKTLDACCGDVKKLPVEKAVSFMVQALRALSYAHGQGIIHRDLKPSNLMVVKDSDVKITDFGLAKRVGAPLSQSGFLVGTPHYMSPEQIDGKKLDGRSDLFSMGVVLYELLCGERPFEGESISTILKGILFDEPRPVFEFNRDIPEELAAVTRKALSKSPEDRFQDADEFISALEGQFVPAASGRETVSLPPPPPHAGKKTRYSVDWKVVAIAGASGGIFTLLLLFGLQYFMSLDRGSAVFKKPANEEVLPTPVEIRTDPPGAKIYLDGKKVQIPMISPNDKRKHRVVAKKGCLSAEQFISYRTESPLLMKLAPKPFQFRVDSSPQGAKIFIDGEETDFVTPALIPRSGCEGFSVALRMDGFSDAGKDVVPSESDMLFLVLSPKAMEGKVRFDSASGSMKFYLEKKFLCGPGQTASLPEGEHTVRIVDESVMGSREVKLTVTPKETVELSVEPFRTGKVFLAGKPEEDGKVSVDGRFFGDLPLTGERRLAVGSHHVSVVSSRGRKVSFEWKIKEGEQKRVVDFDKKKASDI